LSVPLLGVNRCVEVKCRANGFRELYAWLEGRDLLIIRADRREPLAVVPLRLAVEIATQAEHHKHRSASEPGAAVNSHRLDQTKR
jgi:hypothetical protein